MSRKIDSLQGLRVLAFLGVFLLHAGLTPNFTRIWELKYSLYYPVL